MCKPLLLSTRLRLSYDTKAAASGWAHLMILKPRHHMLGMPSMTTHWTPNTSATHSMAADRALERIIFAFPANICLIHRRQTFLTYGCECDTGNSRIWNYTRRFLLICLWLWHYFRTATRNTIRQALRDFTSDRENTPPIKQRSVMVQVVIIATVIKFRQQLIIILLTEGFGCWLHSISTECKNTHDCG
jgi:hypothetical protein